MVTSKPLYAPIPNAYSLLADFTRYCGVTDLHEFSLKDPDQFWTKLLDWMKLPIGGSPDPVRTSETCENALFFPNLTLNYAEALLAGADQEPAIAAYHDDAPPDRLTRGELRNHVGCAATLLKNLGLRPGDHVAAIVRNNAAAVIAALATIAIGCRFCSVPPELGEDGIIDRLSQVTPKCLLHNEDLAAKALYVVDHLRGVDGNFVDCGLMTIEMCAEAQGALTYDEQLAAAKFEYPQFPFNQPIFTLFSSGTTGTPKCIVHGAGGTLLEHVKEHRLHCDIRPADKLFFYTSCAWMMWNWQLSALASHAEIVLYDGSISGPDTLWLIASAEAVSHFGTSPMYLKLCQDQAYQPPKLLSLRSVMSTGSILYDQQFEWFYSVIKDVPLQSISGGTDIVGCFVLGSPALPVYRGECQCISLGMDVRAVNGELVCANPFPSRPLEFFGDDGSRFHDAYFSQNEGMWTHGDFIEISQQGTVRMLGRSDGVMNIRGIRVGPAEIYKVLQDFREIEQVLAVSQDDYQEAAGVRIVLLVKPARNHSVTADLAMSIRRKIGAQLSSVHVPAVIAEVSELPITFNGKLSEYAATCAVNNKIPRNLEALRNPDCLNAIIRNPSLRRRRKAYDYSQIKSLSLPEQMTKIFEETLGISPIKPDDDYFHLGGDSLLAVSMMLAIEEVTGQTLPVSTLIEHRSVNDFVRLLGSNIKDSNALVIQVRQGSGAPVFILPGLSGTVLEQNQLLRMLTTSRPLYVMQAWGIDGVKQPLRRVPDIARMYIDAIHHAQPEGPYTLIGYSFGGMVAYEMACQLGKDSVEQVILLDTAIHPRFLPPSLRIKRRAHLTLLLGRGLVERSIPEATVFFGKEVKRMWRNVLVLLLGTPKTYVIGDQVAMPPAMESVRAACVEAFTNYRPPHYDGCVDLIQASERSERDVDPKTIWRCFARTVQLDEVYGSHLALIEEPAVSSVARILSKKLEQYERQRNRQAA